ncbi:hypothetical protein [Alcanivorax sp.]|uniref:hypothetical protein n=1 Tax=Alcanivorax sp. TaxID=1872427 RepID=UPI00243C122D|nr:hypothetical protein [Alcanivorax sp.]
MSALRNRLFSDSARYRWAVFARVVAAFVGGYMLSSMVLLLLSLTLPLPQAEAIATGTMLGFILYALIIIWAFSIKRLRTVWLGLLIGSLACAPLILWLMPEGGA